MWMVVTLHHSTLGSIATLSGTVIQQLISFAALPGSEADVEHFSPCKYCIVSVNVLKLGLSYHSLLNFRYLVIVRI